MAVGVDLGGDLAYSRVVADPGAALSQALDDALTGYAELVPADALLLGEGGDGLVAFEDGVPVRVRHSAGAVGADAVAALVRAGLDGPLHVRFYEHADPPLDAASAVEADALAERLAGDPALAERTRERAPDSPEVGQDAVAAFLDDADRIAEIRAQARDEAEARAAELGFDPVGDADDA